MQVVTVVFLEAGHPWGH